MKHKVTIQTIVLTFCAALVIASLSWSGGNNESPTRADAVFADTKPPELTDDNLVDGLGSLNLPVPIAKVDLARNILSVDLKIIEDNFDAGQIYLGMAEIIAFSFERTGNVDQLLLRLVAEDRWLGTKYLLLAADVHRSDWSQEEIAELRETGNREMSGTLRELLRITETELWKSKFPN